MIGLYPHPRRTNPERARIRFVYFDNGRLAGFCANRPHALLPKIMRATLRRVIRLRLGAWD